MSKNPDGNIVEYRLNPEIIDDVVAVPGMIFDSELKLASGDQIKILLWLLRNGKGSFVVEVCSRETGVKENVCMDALNYWMSRAIILPSKSVMPINTDNVSVSTKKNNDFEIKENINKDAAKIERPQKPQMKDVIEKQKSNEDFAFLLNESSARLGKPINHGEMGTLLYLCDTIGLPVSVILLIIGYAVSVNKGNMRYIERVAIDWAERGIDNVDAAEELLCSLERRTSSWNKVSRALGIEKRPTASELNAAERWIFEWKFSEDLIKIAYEVCMAKIQKFRSSYIDKILSGWQLDGVDSVEKALKALEPPSKNKGFGKGAASKNKKSKGKTKKDLSLDFDDYDNMVADFVPVYRKKERE